MDDVPPDLARLGQELSSAIDRSLRRQRLRQRLVNRAAKVGMPGALIFIALTPAVLQPASIGIEERILMPWPDDTDTIARLCEPSQRNPAPVCNDKEVVVASVDRAVDARILPKLLVGSRSPSNER
jgi:hypothetical protein